jgi:hypothetical protein
MCFQNGPDRTVEAVRRVTVHTAIAPAVRKASVTAIVYATVLLDHSNAGMKRVHTAPPLPAARRCKRQASSSRVRMRGVRGPDDG